MNIIIIYFSGTGNTQLIAEQLTLRFENLNHVVELVSIEDKNKMEHLDYTNKVIGFGFPVYKLTYPDIFSNIIESINLKATSNKYFLFSTYARFDENSFIDFSLKLNPEKFTLIGKENFKAPSCGISARKLETEFEYKSVMFFEDSIHIKLDHYVHEILEFSTQSIKGYNRLIVPLQALKSKIVENIEITKYPKLQIDLSKCSLCKRCLKQCPENNFSIVNNRLIVKEDKKCLHCLRCMNHCTSNAIIFGKLTIGENRYTIKKRDELFTKAISGYKETYWSNIDKIIKDWRKKTIKYWINNWYRAN